MENPTLNTFIIDIETHDAKRCITRLRRLVWIHSAENGGVYREDPSYTQIHVVTDKDEAKIDQWLYDNNFDYVGVVSQK